MFKRFTVGFAAGYVLGARAGRERYDQIVQLAQRLEEMPVVGDVADRGRDFASDGGQRLVDSLRDRLPAVSSLWSGGHDSRDEDEESEEEYGDEQDEYEDEDEAGGDEDEEDEQDEEEQEEQPARSRGSNGSSSNGRPSRQSARRPSPQKRSGSRRGGGPAKRSSSARSRGRLGSVVSAARERGKVD